MINKQLNKLILLIPFSMAIASVLYAQDTLKKEMTNAVDTIKPAATKQLNTLIISVDMRTRTELRHGYRAVPTEDTGAAFFTNQRTRLNFDFKSKKLDFWALLLDTRVW
jgi:hypothetical protein